MNRRRLLSTVCATGLSSLFVGCKALDGVVSGEDRTASRDGSENGSRETRTTASRNARTVAPGESVSTASSESRDVVVRSRVDTPRSVRVRVSDGDSDVFNQEFDIPAGSVIRRRKVVTRSGQYRVRVRPSADSDARSSFQWRVRELYGDLGVILTESGIRYAQRVTCEPACEGISQEGTARDLPYTENSTRLFDPAWIEIRNPTSVPRTARVSVADGGETVLAYTYEVPPGLRPVIPAVGSTGSYSVSVSASGIDRQYDWEVPEQPRLFVRLGDTPRIDCGRVSGNILIQNKHDSDQLEVS